MLVTQNKGQTPSAETPDGTEKNQQSSPTLSPDQSNAVNQQSLSKEQLGTSPDSLLVKSTQAAIAHEGQQGFKTVRLVERPNFLENFGNTIRGHGIENSKTEEKRVPVVSPESSTKEPTNEAPQETIGKTTPSEEQLAKTASKLDEEKEKDALQPAA